MQTATNQILSSGTMTGQNIVNTAGETLGKIEDVMLDIDNGRIAYVVLSFGGFMGIGDKLFAVPMSALTPNAKKEHFEMDVTKERLDNAPGFDKNNWPTSPDRDFMNSVYTHYSAKPYWT